MTTTDPERTQITSIAPAKNADIDEVRTLFREYEAFLSMDLCFQGFEEELAGLPGKYAPPSGALLIARGDGRVAGCVGVRGIGDQQCEMKRLFVRPEFRGLGLGRRLAEQIIEEAVSIGYKHMKLDTFGFLEEAVQLYRTLGFREIEAYYDNPLDGVQYWELDMRKA